MRLARDSSMLPIYINGRFLSQPITGVQRYAAEVVTALDKLLVEGRPAHLPQGGVKLLVPQNACQQLSLRYISTRRIGRLKGHLWEQLELPGASSDGVLVGLANTGPLWHPRQLITIHDASVFANPGNFSLAFRTWYRLLIPRLGQRAKTILTVSEFSRSELIRYCNFPETKIEVVYNGVDHIIREPADQDFLSGRNIKPGNYFLCVATSSRNKNIGLVMDALQFLGDVDLDLATVGGTNSKVFSEPRISRKCRMHELGYVSDSQLRALYENALCFVFPSLYEGFGIPPLEAMACGCPVIVARTSALPESCGDCALYCDPYDARGLASQIKSLRNDMTLRLRLKDLGKGHSSKFTWNACAQHVLAALSKLAFRYSPPHRTVTAK
jgi:glycosyltransferase involved in cell wall biosynthesis